MLAKLDVIPELIMTLGRKSDQRPLWLGLFMGPIAYVLYLSVGYLLLSGICRIEAFQMRVGGLSLCSVLLLALTLLSSLITLLTGLTNFRRLRRKITTQCIQPGDRLPALLCAGAALSVFFTALILLTGIPLFVLQSWGWL